MMGLSNGPEGRRKLDAVLPSTGKKGESGMFQRVCVFARRGPGLGHPLAKGSFALSSLIACLRL